ncbi:MAG: hypothetical protein K0Q89_114 [Thermomicrobiales bacterium]|jgi:hypothetical protein|nr:hypothetical protein [Thermomicrobiales bacterium]
MAAPVYRSAVVTSTFNGSVSFVVDMPAGAAVGDFIAALVYCPDGFYGSAADLTPPGGGWVTVAEVLIGNAPIAGIYYLIPSGAPSATYTWTKNDGSNATAVVVAVEAGTFDATNPLGSSPASGTDYSIAHDGTAGTTVDVPTITPAVDECLGIALASAVESSYTWTPPSGFTERADSHDGTSYVSSSAATAALTTSATGALSFTANASVGANKGVGAIVALRPEPPPPSETLRPDADVARVGWVNESAGTTNLWQSIDETTTNDSDYVTVTI